MDNIKEIFTWIISNWDSIITMLLAFIGGVEVIVKWTETDKDDKAVSTLKSIIQKVNSFGIELISYITKLKGTK